MSTRDNVRFISNRALKFAITMGHSVLMLVVLWVTMDILQSTVREPAKVLMTQKAPVTVLSHVLNQGPIAETPVVSDIVTAMHDYGYHAQKAFEATRVPEKPVVPVKSVSCPIAAKAVLAKAIPKAEKAKNPKVMVKHALPSYVPDARGPISLRVDL